MKLQLHNQLSGLFSKIKNFILPIILLVVTNSVFGQALTQSGFTGITVPKFMASGTASRMPVIFRATVSGLAASTAYKYYVQGATNATTGGGTIDIGSTNSGAGNPILINTAGTAIVATSAPTLLTSGTTCETFTTDASGSYTGWFGFLNTGNARFTAGNIVFPSISIGLATGTTVSVRRALDLGITVLAFGTTAATATLVKSTSLAAAKNFAVIYDNVSGTGRPTSVGLIESIGASVGTVPVTYSATAGSWNIICPNNNAGGIQRIENRNIANTLLGCAIDADGTWPTGSINTVTMTGSTTTPVVIASADAPLTSCAGTTLITATGTLAAVNTVYGTASATTSFVASGSGLTSDIVVTAPAGYEISQTIGGTSGFATSQTLLQTSGNVANTTIYVRLAATTLSGSYAGNVTCTATGATTINVATITSTVSKKSLTIAGATANNKIYDRTTVATFVGGSLVGIVNADALVLVTSGTFATANAGNAKPVTSSFSLTGANATSYTLTQPIGLTANITQKNLTINSAAVANKVYDGNITAVLTGILVNVIAPDDVTLLLTANFETPFAGTALAITSTSTITGADIANYNLIQPTGLIADITPKPLTIASPIAGNKVFDGNTTAVLTGTLVGAVIPDDVNVNLTATFASSVVGLNIPVTSTSTLFGADIANYSLTQPIGLTANISAAALLPQTITFNSLSDVSYGTAPLNLSATATSGLAVTYTSSDPTLATVSGNVVTIKGAGFVTITASQTGNATYDAAPTVDQSFIINPKDIIFTTAIGNNKIYDGTNTATFAGTLGGIVGSDVVTFSGTGFFADVNVNSLISITSTAVLTGANAGNYNLIQVTELNADITKKTLTISGATAGNKVYNGNAIASITGAALVGLIGADIVTVSGSGTFASANVANGIAVATNLVLAGANAGNYAVTQPTGLTANITKAALTIVGLAGANKVYDKLLTASLIGTPTLVGIIAADVVTVAGTPTALFATKTVGTAKPITVTGFTLAGAQSNNYLVTQPTGFIGNITKLDITITSAIAQNKDFDGTTAATITGTLTGIISPDVVTIVGAGAFASSAVGNAITVTANISLAGTDAPNYNLAAQPTGLTANIVPGPTVLAIGDLSILGFNFNGQDAVNFVTWVDLLPNTLIKFTDNPFIAAVSANANNNVRGGENFVIWKNSGALVPAGTVISITDNVTAGITSLGTIVSGNLNGLAGGGDNIFAYQGAATSGATPDFTANTNPTTFNGTVLFGLLAQGTGNAINWLQFGTANTNTSYLPTQLNVPNGNIVIANSATRGQYSGSRTNQVSLLNYRALVNNNANWITGATTTGAIVLNNTNFTLATPPTASVLSGTATICAGSSANINVIVTGGTAPFTIVYTDGSTNSTVTSYTSGTAIAVSPNSNTTYTLISVTDANALIGAGNSGSGIITVNQLLTFYADADGDGFGNSAMTQLACTQPTGYVANATDCNDADALIFQNGLLFTDADNDAYTIGAAQTICYGATVPAGFKLTSLGIDCDDTNAAIYRNGLLFTDADNDGYTVGAAQTVCYGATVPTGLSLTSLGTDCVDNNPNINPGKAEILYNGIDDNCDGSLDEGNQLKTKVQATQCGQTLPFLTATIYAKDISYSSYRFRVKNNTTNVVQTIVKANHWFRLNELASFDYATSYTIDIEIQRLGVWLGYYGDTCVVSTPAVVNSPGVSTLAPASCGALLTGYNQSIFATLSTGVTGYKFRISGNAEPVEEITRLQQWFTLSMFPTPRSYGKTYTVEVAVKTTGAYTAYGAVCTITTPSAPGLTTAFCNLAIPSKLTAISTSVCTAATGYRFQITDPANQVQTVDRVPAYFNLLQLPQGYLPNTIYGVKVAVKTGTGAYSDYGPSCNITTPAGTARGNDAAIEDVMSDVVNQDFKVIALPNPFTSNFGFDIASFTDTKVGIKIYDMIGKLLESREVEYNDIINQSIGENYPSGVYNVIVSQGDNLKTLRVIKR